ncbi:CYTH-like domain-containing protein [Ephemerocybe angulata]|uniref:mRNA-capping enzyme subunit beta n=1 Tax=Ephemerocybe angulata TaxID=980116 RepID=A0A8H6M8A5_9AGAR|nr:CYTH-like domain-containing protein [Tulosesus angulatus]
MIVTRPEHLGGVVEVEAKIGLIVDRAAGGRLKLPVLVETVLDPNAPLDIRFESNMSSTQHRHYNTLLNSLKTDQPTASPLDYSHLYLLDNFFPAPSDPASDSGRGGDKVRVTRDEKTSQVVQCVKKIRLGDLNVWSPHHKADWRVSVNLEVPVQHPLGSPSYTRRKDRMRYTHEEFVIDLTQVTTHSAPNAPPQQILHELELEIARPELLLATAAKRNDVTVSEHERSAFDELIRAFVNNARILVKIV